MNIPPWLREDAGAMSYNVKLDVQYLFLALFILGHGVLRLSITKHQLKHACLKQTLVLGFRRLTMP